MESRSDIDAAVAPALNIRKIDREAAVNAVRSFMVSMGFDEGPHTADTPERVFRAWVKRTEGYDASPAEILSTRFPVQDDPGLVIISGLSFASTCAHHLLPIEGLATVAYRPDREQREVVGLSKLARLLRAYASRLQVQEMIGRQTVDALISHLSPVGAGVAITAHHGCMSLRGIDEPGATTTTLALGGEWTSEHPDVRHLMNEHSKRS